MKNKILLLLAICSLSAATVFPQAGSLSDLRYHFKDAEYDYSQEDYYLALSKYVYIYRFDSLNSNVNFCMGVCYLKTAFDKTKAMPFLERAVKNVTKNYNDGTYDEKNAREESFLYLGQAYRLNNEIDKAIEAFNSYKKLLKPNDKQNLQIVDKELMQCFNAKKAFLQKPVVSVTRKNISDLNAAFSDYNAVFNKDENIAVFITQQLDGKSNDDMVLMYSKKINGKWSESVDLTDNVSTKGNMWPTYLSNDGQYMLLAEDDDSKTAIYESHYRTGKTDTLWSSAKKISGNINKGKVTHAVISPDGKFLVFTSDRKEGLGGLDIYKSEKGVNGEWGPAVNLGPKINTPFNEETPFFLNDNTLYFSSEGHSSIGGYDIFYSKLVNAEWTNPINLGYKFNTTDDNLFFEPTDDGNSGYSSFTGEDATGEKDIFKVTISPYKEEIVQNTENNQSQDIQKEVKQDIQKEDEIKKINEQKEIEANKKLAEKNTKTDLKNQTNNSNKTSANYKYLIQIAASTKEENPYGFIKLKGVKQNKSKRSLYIYTYGEYLAYSSALKDLPVVQEVGFKDAFIIGYSQFSERNFENGDETDKVKLVQEIIKEMGQTFFSIQFGAFKKQIEFSRFKGIQDIQFKLTSNGFYIYYTGKFVSYGKAKIEVEKIKGLGYLDAFIIHTPK